MGNSTGLRAYLDSRRPAPLVDYAVDIEHKMRAQMGGDNEGIEIRIKKKIWNEVKDKRTPGDDIGQRLFSQQWLILDYRYILDFVVDGNEMFTHRYA